MDTVEIKKILARDVRITPIHLERFTKQWHNLERFKLMAAADILLALAHPREWVRLSSANATYATVVWRMWRKVVDEADGTFIIRKGFCSFTDNAVFDTSDIHLSEDEVATLGDDGFDPYGEAEFGTAAVPLVRREDQHDKE